MEHKTRDTIIFDNPGVVREYFPALDTKKEAQLEALGELYAYWNERINVISRKDIIHLYPRHILHSLGIAKVFSFKAGAEVLDIGTGGGLPGIPLAILFPETKFYLLDAIQKKIKVITYLCEALELTNVIPLCQRAEEVRGSFDFVVSRAVASLSRLSAWTQGKIKSAHIHDIPNGLLCWKGGDLREELKACPMAYKAYSLEDIFSRPSFQDKYIIHLY